MRPIRIEIENLRSFQTKRTIEFGSPRLFAILGDTGAGKTSILEAITYALFNRSTWDGRAVTELIAKGSGSMSVTFTFEVDGDEFTVTRVTRQGRAPTQRLECPARGISLSAQSEVDGAIRNSLQLDAETFLHTVLLPQGKHAELLTKNPNQRNQILAEIFRLDEIGPVLDRARILETRAETAVNERRRQRRDLGEDPSAALQATLIAQEKAQVALTAAVAGVEEGRLLAARAAEIDQETLRRQMRITSLEVPDNLLQRYAAIAAIEAEIAAGEADVSNAREEAQIRRQAADAQRNALKNAGRDDEALRAVERSLDRVVAERRELDTAESRKAELQATVAEKRAGLADKTVTVKKVRESEKQAKTALASAQASLETLKGGLATFERLVSDWASAKETCTVAVADAKRKAGERDGLRTKHAAAREREAMARTAYDRAEEALDKARIADQAAAISVHLHSGDACPVCERPLPRTFAPRKSQGLTKAQKAEQSATAQLETASRELHQLTGSLEKSEAAAAEAQAQAEKATTAMTAAEKRLRAIVPRTIDPDRHLAQERQNQRKLEGQVQKLEAAHEKAETELASALKAQTFADAELQSLKSQVEQLEETQRSRREELARIVASIPEPFRPDREGAGVDAARAAVLQGQIEAKAVAQALLDANKAVAAANAEIAKFRQRTADEVVSPREHLLGTLAPIGTTLGLPRQPKREPARSAWVEQVVAAATEGREGAAAALRELTIAKDELQTAREALVARLGGEPDNVHADALRALERARAVREGAERAQAKALELEAQLQRLEPAYTGLTTLKSVLGARGFPPFAVARRQERLLEVASGILSQMVDGRYAFAPNFQILDRLSNEVRSSLTLSGGEKFLASLALSLAVVEIAASGGAKIGSLFLDEGFDSLDATMLPIAMLELRKRSHAGRTICVITHVSDAARFVSDTFMVRNTADGTDVTHLDGPVDEDTSAVEGLVAQLGIR